MTQLSIDHVPDFLATFNKSTVTRAKHYCRLQQPTAYRTSKMKPSITVSRHLQRCVRLTPAAQPATLRNNLLRNVNKSRIHAPKRPYTTSQVHKQPPAPSPSIRQRLVKYGARSLFIGLCFQLGFSFGTWSDEIPEPMTEEDEDELAFIDAEFLSLPGVEEFYNNPQSYECPVQFGSTRGAKHRIEHAFEGSRGWSFLVRFISARLRTWCLCQLASSLYPSLQVTEHQLMLIYLFVAAIVPRLQFQRLPSLHNARPQHVWLA